MNSFLDDSDDDMLSDINLSDQPQVKHLQVLKKYFGHNEFREMQWKIIRSLIEEGMDNCVIMATGYGKSLCYQFPAVYMSNKITLVVSPLVSLMEDQVMALQMNGVKACLLGTAQKTKSIFSEIVAGNYCIVYLTPEFLTGDAGHELLQKIYNKVALIAIDEAHCISQWGSDFRTCYRSLGILKRNFPNIPIVALTATATHRVQDDICKSLNLINPVITRASFDRPNLHYYVHMKSSNVIDDLKPYIKEAGGSAIIYVITRNETESIAQKLNAVGIKCEPYHAGLAMKKRREVHEDFARDKLQVIVATIAFGMGIDKKDVRIVIHYGPSKDLESYYQESGRAGRDGVSSKCVVFYNRYDFSTLAGLSESSGSLQVVKEHKEDLLKTMIKYVEINTCRRMYILRYFDGEDVPEVKHDPCCDNCIKNKSANIITDKDIYENLDENGDYDFTEEAKLFLESVKYFGGFRGIGPSTMLLTGKSSLDEKHRSSPLFGKGKSKSADWWKLVGALLDREGYLKRQRGGNFNINKFVSTVAISRKGAEFLSSLNMKMKFPPTNEMKKFLKRKGFAGSRSAAVVGASSSHQNMYDLFLPKPKNIEDELYKLLLKIRNEIAVEYDYQPYMIASNNALTQMAKDKPKDLQEMKNCGLDGFSDAKISKFGALFIKAIKKFMDENDEILTMRHALIQYPQNGIKATDAVSGAFSLWKQGRNVTEIALTKNIAESTACDYLCKAIGSGYEFTKRDLARMKIDEKLFAHIVKNLPDDLLGQVLLRDVKERCLPHVSYDNIKIVLAYRKVRQYLDKLGIKYHDPDRVEIEVKQYKKGEEKENASSTNNLWSDDDNEITDEVLAGIETSLLNSYENKKELEIETIDLSKDDEAKKKPSMKVVPMKRNIYADSSDDDDPPPKKGLQMSQESSNWLSK